MHRTFSQQRFHAFTLIEIMIVVGIIALLAAIATPALLRAHRRSQAVLVKADLRQIDGAIDQYALEFSKKENSTVSVAAWKLYTKPGSRLYVTGTDVLGQAFGDQAVGALPVVPSTSWDALTDVADSSFWSPYSRGN